MTLSQTRPDQLPDSAPRDGRIVRVDEPLRLAALERLLRSGDSNVQAQAHTRRFMQYAQATGLDLTNLWALLDAEENVVAATLVVPNPGRTAMLFSSHPRTTSDVQYVARLIDHASRRTGNLDVQLAQVLLDPDDSLDLAAYRLGGYDQLAILSYLARPAPTARQAAQPSWPEGVCVVPYCQELREPLLEVLDATYEDTLDCPGLFGLRRTQDILTGHQSTGDFDPSLWSMLQIDGAYMGALLLNPAPAHRSIELVYLGLAKAARGRALGTQLLRHGLAQLAGRRERTINLAVDDRNTPAIQLYHRSGFRPTMRRIALTRSLR